MGIVSGEATRSWVTKGSTDSNLGQHLSCRQAGREFPRAGPYRMGDSRKATDMLRRIHPVK